MANFHLCLNITAFCNRIMYYFRCLFLLVFIVPPVTVSISQDRTGTLYAGTSFFFKCDIMVSPLVTIPFTVTNQWTRNDTNVPMGPSDDTITDELNMIDRLNYYTTLTFYPLNNDDDSGVYTCNIEVTAPSYYTYLRNTSASANASITVTGIILYIIHVHIKQVACYLILALQLMY